MSWFRRAERIPDGFTAEQFGALRRMVVYTASKKERRCSHNWGTFVSSVSGGVRIPDCQMCFGCGAVRVLTDNRPPPDNHHHQRC